MAEKEDTPDSVKKQNDAIKHMQELIAKLDGRASKLKSESAELGKNLMKEKDD
jgi:hypothetical protein